MSKPTAKPAAPAAKEEAPVAAPPKSKKMLIIIIVLLLVIIGGGAAWFLTKGHAPTPGGHAEEVKVEPVGEPKYVPLGDHFIANLKRENDDSPRALQIAITLKILQAELEEKIKTKMPEIQNAINILLSDKTPSQIETVEGKKQLAAEIIAKVDVILGLESAPAHTALPIAAAASAVAHEGAAHEGEGHAASAVPSAVASAPTIAAPAAPKTKGIVDVLFTSFIIQ